MPVEPLEILHRDERLLAVAKPSGLVVHRSARAGDRDNVMKRLRTQTGVMVWPVHRLDRGTSGVLLFALDTATARTLAEAFAGRAIAKSYLAVVRGWPPESALVERPLRGEDGRESAAATRVTRLATVELPVPVGPHPSARYALVQAQALTGREHQVRRHLRSLNHPLVGDTTWGDSDHNRLFRERFGSRRLLLHAAALRLEWPPDSHLHLRAPLPADLAPVLAALGFLEAAEAALAAGVPREAHAA